MEEAIVNEQNIEAWRTTTVMRWSRQKLFKSLRSHKSLTVEKIPSTIEDLLGTI